MKASEMVPMPGLVLVEFIKQFTPMLKEVVIIKTSNDELDALLRERRALIPLHHDGPSFEDDDKTFFIVKEDVFIVVGAKNK